MEVKGRSVHAGVLVVRVTVWDIQYEWTFDATCVAALNRVCVRE